jgi:serpin B
MSYRASLAAFAAAFSFLGTLVGAAAPAVALKPRVPPPEPASPVTAFASDAFADLASTEGNLAFSPASIYLALGLLESGAGDADAAMIARALHTSTDAKDRDAILAQLVKTLTPKKVKKGQKAAIVQVGDGVWIRKGEKLKKSYVKRVAKNLKAQIASLDFARAPERSRKAINKWIAQHTGQKIKELLPDGAVTKDTEAVLANAVYFLGAWADAFDKEMTTDGTFSRADGKDVTVPMMQRSGTASYADTGDARILELPYQGSDLAMDLVLPDDGTSLHDLEVSVGQRIDGWTAALTEQDDVQIAIPRFHIDQSTNLHQMLVDLGLGKLFEGVDMSNMLAKGGELAVTGAYHQTVVDVNEKGTEAAAATAVVMEPTMVREHPAFVANQPFLWMIRDTKTGAIIFMGRIADPSA